VVQNRFSDSGSMSVFKTTQNCGKHERVSLLVVTLCLVGDRGYRSLLHFVSGACLSLGQDSVDASAERVVQLMNRQPVRERVFCTTNHRIPDEGVFRGAGTPSQRPQEKLARGHNRCVHADVNNILAQCVARTVPSVPKVVPRR
jgi:hypothetical protein